MIMTKYPTDNIYPVSFVGKTFQIWGLGRCLATVIIDILKMQMYAGCNNTNIKLKQNLRTVYLHDFF